MFDINWNPVLLSLQVAAAATACNLVAGTALAYILAKREFFGKDLLDTIIMQPLIMPPSVLGYYLLVLLGSRGPLGRFAEDVFGISLVFTLKGAVIAAMVASLPLFIKPVRAAIESIDEKLENSARLLGKNEWEVFRQVTLPLSRRGFIAGTVLTFARSVGEFGATLMVAGNIPFKTQTAAIAIYDAVQAGDQHTANILVGIMTLISVAILYAVNKTVTLKYY